MGAERQPDPAVLIVGILAGAQADLERGLAVLAAEFGEPALLSEVWPFVDTNYYEDELGPDILRQFVAYRPEFDPGRIGAVKRRTNQLEADLAKQAGRPPESRPVNLDPGYITLAKLVLATTKDQAHRIYLGENMLAEVTLRYQKGGWRTWPWTYADYASGAYFPFFDQVRETLRASRDAHRG